MARSAETSHVGPDRGDTEWTGTCEKIGRTIFGLKCFQLLALGKTDRKPIISQHPDAFPWGQGDSPIRGTSHLLITLRPNPPPSRPAQPPFREP